eukprot:s603_g24.t1
MSSYIHILLFHVVMALLCCTSCGDPALDEELKPTLVQPSVLNSLEDNTYIAVVKGSQKNLITCLDVSDPGCIIVKDVAAPMFAEWNSNNRNQQIQVYDQLIKVNGDPCNSRALREGMQVDAKSEELYLTMKHPDERLVAFEKSDHLGLDISFRKTLSTRPWISAVSGGTLETWNIENPNLAVAAHDRILAINGVSGAALEMVEKLKDPKSSYVYMTVLHYGIGQEAS